MPSTMDMTRGRPTKLLAHFALPLFLTIGMQQLYQVADSAVVGRMLGANAFAAIGGAGFYSWLVIDIILGLTQGFGTLFAQLFGAGSKQELRRAIGASAVLSLAISLVMTPLAVGFAHPVLRMIGTPAETIGDAAWYLRVLLAGTPICMFFNASASLLRAAGDSRTPMAAMIISSIVNVALDVLLISLFGMGVAGTAATTVAAQGISLVICLRKIDRLGFLRLKRPDFRVFGEMAGRLLTYGLPLALRNAIISAGGFWVQAAINAQGALFVAGLAAAKRLFGLLDLLAASLDGALATFVGQNYGAGRGDRVRTGLRIAVAWALVASAAIMAATFIFGESVLALLIKDTPEVTAQILEYGVTALRIMALGMPALYLLYMFRSTLEGIGRPKTSLVSGFLELGARLVCACLIAPKIGAMGIYIADGVGWICAAAFLIISCLLALKKIK